MQHLHLSFKSGVTSKMDCVTDGINRLLMILTGRWLLVRRLPRPLVRVPVKEDQVR